MDTQQPGAGRWCMNNDEEASYAHNSSVQGDSIDQIKPALVEAIAKMRLPCLKEGASTIVTVADFGCSFGPNAVNIMEFIIDRLRDRYAAAAKEQLCDRQDMPKFLACFSDLPANDFNALFRLLSTANGRRKYLIGGFPGSFYTQLIPSSSVHVSFSSYALQWLSKIPDAVLDKNSPAFNKGQIWILGENSGAAKAYADQAQKDWQTFFSVRAEELVSGGSMTLIVPGRAHPDSTKVGDEFLPWGIAQQTMSEMVSQGLIEEHLLDSFNLPIYCPSTEEVDECLNKFRDVFVIEQMQLQTTPFIRNASDSDEEVSITIRLFLQSVFGGMWKAKFGQATAHLFWHRMQDNARQQVQKLRRAGPLIHVLVLTRK